MVKLHSPHGSEICLDRTSITIIEEDNLGSSIRVDSTWVRVSERPAEVLRAIDRAIDEEVKELFKRAEVGNVMMVGEDGRLA